MTTQMKKVGKQNSQRQLVCLKPEKWCPWKVRYLYAASTPITCPCSLRVKNLKVIVKDEQTMRII